MAYYRTCLEIEQPIDEVFGYLADFSNTAEWDPGVARARLTSEEPLGRGSRFRVVARFLGNEVRMNYRIVQYEPPTRLVLEGRSPGLRAVDTIELEKSERGTRLTWDANLALEGLRYVFDLPLHLVFQRTGKAAIDGLREALARPQRHLKQVG